MDERIQELVNKLGLHEEALSKVCAYLKNQNKFNTLVVIFSVLTAANLFLDARTIKKQKAAIIRLTTEIEELKNMKGV